MHLLVLVLQYFQTDGPSGDGSTKAKLPELAVHSVVLLRPIFSQTLSWRMSFPTHLLYLFHKQWYDTNAGRVKMSSMWKLALGPGVFSPWSCTGLTCRATFINYDESNLISHLLEFEVSSPYYCKNTQLAALTFLWNLRWSLKKCGFNYSAQPLV